MTAEKKTWLITGAGRGMGVDIAKAVLAAGHDVVATGRNPDAVAESLGDADHMLVAVLDVTSTQDAEAAVKAAVDRFGGIDVLVNNAASFYAGFFEELTPEQMDQQITTSLIGPMNVTRAVLPVMRKQRSGHVVTISSSAGFAGFEYGTAYAASKFGVDGWMESLAPEIEPFGIHTTVVNPGFFRTSRRRVAWKAQASRPSRSSASGRSALRRTGRPCVRVSPGVVDGGGAGLRCSVDLDREFALGVGAGERRERFGRLCEVVGRVHGDA